MEKQQAHVDISWMVFYKNNLTLKTFKKQNQTQSNCFSVSIKKTLSWNTKLTLEEARWQTAKVLRAG